MIKTHAKIIKNIITKAFHKKIVVIDLKNGVDFLEEVIFIFYYES